MTILNILVGAVFGVSAIQDAIDGKIHLFLTILPGIAGLITRFSFLTLGMGAIFAFVGVAAFRMKFWKKGDMFLMISTGFWLGMYGMKLVTVFLLVATVYIAGYRFLFDTDEIRAGPMFLLVYLCMLF